MATETYTKGVITGGASNALDSIDGDTLADGYKAVVITDEYTYTYYLDATSGATEASPFIVAPDSNPGNKRWLLVNHDNVLNVKKLFGAKGDNSTDDTAAIQAALDYADAILPLAQTLYFPAGKYIISSTLTVHSQGIKLVGDGGNYIFEAGDLINGSLLKWTGGASPMMIVTPNLTSHPVIQPKLSRFGLDGQGTATVGLRIEACYQGIFEELSIAHCTDIALHTRGTSLSGFSGSNYTHSCTFRNLSIDQRLAGDGDGIILDGESSVTGTGASTTVCGFYEINISHCDGDGLRIDRGDNNMFYKLAVGRPTTGSGEGIIFSATADAPSVNTNAMFYGLGGKGGIRSEAGTVDAVGNSIYALSIDSSNPAPVIESGSTLYYHQMFDATDSNQTFGENRIKINGDYYNPFVIIGSHTYGINLVDGTYSASQLRLKNNTPVTARNAADSADIELFRSNTSDELFIGPNMRFNSLKGINFNTTDGGYIGGTATQKVGFWGKGPKVQPVDIPNTSGVGLTTLEAEVNSVKQLLRSIGLMAS